MLIMPFMPATSFHGSPRRSRVGKVEKNPVPLVYSTFRRYVWQQQWVHCPRGSVDTNASWLSCLSLWLSLFACLPVLLPFPQLGMITMWKFPVMAVVTKMSRVLLKCKNDQRVLTHKHNQPQSDHVQMSQWCESGFLHRCGSCVWSLSICERIKFDFKWKLELATGAGKTSAIRIPGHNQKNIQKT